VSLISAKTHSAITLEGELEAISSVAEGKLANVVAVGATRTWYNPPKRPVMVVPVMLFHAAADTNLNCMVLLTPVIVPLNMPPVVSVFPIPTGALGRDGN
jgi:hypothetical protein